MSGVYRVQGKIASLFYSKAALADSVEDPLEAPPLCSKVALADSSLSKHHLSAARSLWQTQSQILPQHLFVENNSVFLLSRHFVPNFHPAPARKNTYFVIAPAQGQTCVPSANQRLRKQFSKDSGPIQGLITRTKVWNKMLHALFY